MSVTRNSNKPLGVFDSGIGGLTVLRSIHQLLPLESTIYLADTKRSPYGNKKISDIVTFSLEIVEYLLQQQVKVIVVACNTATAAAINILRDKFPQMEFIGTEPAIKPGIINSKTKIIGIMATQNTLQSNKYKILINKFAQDTKIIEDPCIGLVDLIESNADDAIILNKLSTIITPMKQQGIDQLVLGCTHYPLVQPQIRQLLGDNFPIVDPNNAIAKRLSTILKSRHISTTSKLPRYTYLTTGDSDTFDQLATKVLGAKVTSTKIDL